MTRGEGLLLQAKLAHAQGEVERAAAQVAQAAHQVGPDAMAEVRALEVAVANHRGRYGEAVLRFEGAAAGLRGAGLLRPLASAMLHAAIALSGRGAYARAIALPEESATDCQQVGAEHLQARVHNTLGGIYRQLGQPGRADEQLARALDLATHTGFEEELAHARVGQAEVALETHDLSRARDWLDRAEGIVHDRRVFYSWRIRMRWLLMLARLALLEGRRDAALTAVSSAAEAAICTASSKYTVLSHAVRAEILGSAEGGQAEARAALELALQMDAPPLVRDAALLVARLTGESLAAGLPDELGRSLIARGAGYS